MQNCRKYHFHYVVLGFSKGMHCEQNFLYTKFGILKQTMKTVLLNE